MKDIVIENEPLLVEIWDEYVDAFETIPNQQGKEYLRSWNHKVPPKLVRQLIMAGVYFGKIHPDKITFVE